MSGVKKGWSVSDSLTCKKKLIKIYREIKYGRYYSFSNKYTEKGIRMEQDAITLYARYRRMPLKKNTERITNSFFTGEPDVINAFTADTKCSWGLDTFPHPMVDKPDGDYDYQGHGYMDLTGVDKHIIAYCLVNAPATMVLREKEKLFYQMDAPKDDDEKFIQAKIDIEKNMIFDMKQFMSDNPFFEIECKDWTYDIPLSERVVEFEVKRDDNKLKAIKDRIGECRSWMNENLFKDSGITEVEFEEEILHTSEDTRPGETTNDYAIRIEEGKRLRQAAKF